MLLSYLHQTAECYIGSAVKDVVIAIPTYYNIQQRAAVKIAAKIAGLNLLRMCATSTCAAISFYLHHKMHFPHYCYRKNNDPTINQLVIDIGDGTIDVSFIQGDDGVIEVKTVSGDVLLGGYIFTHILMNHFAKEFKDKYKMDCTKSHRSMLRLKTQCERVKRTLSAASRANIEIDSFYNGIDFESSINREIFEKLCMQYFKQCITVIDGAFLTWKNKWGQWFPQKTEVDDIIMIGGSSRIPILQKLVKEYFDGKDLCTRLHIDEPVVFGACICAAILNKTDIGNLKDVLLLDAVALGLGLQDEQGDFVPVVARNTTIPCKKWKIIENDNDDQRRMRVNIFEEIVPKRRQIIFDGTKNYLVKYQPIELTEVLIDVIMEYVGLSIDTYLGQLSIEIVPKPKGESKVEVILDLDANSHLLVIAQEKHETGTYQPKTLEIDPCWFSDTKMQQMIHCGNQRRIEDAKIKELNDVRNKLEDYAYKIKDSLYEDINNSLQKMDRDKINDKVNEIIEWLDDNTAPNKEELISRYNKLETFCSEFKLFGEI